MTTHDEELLARIRELRVRGSTPKQIAKALGLRPAQAAALVRRVAEAALTNTAPDERPVVGCWVNAGWSAGLDMAEAPDWAAADPLGQEPDPGTGGFAQILLARQERASRVTVTGFLVDVYCLGVKNVTAPEVMGSGSLTTYVPMYYSAFDQRPLPIGVEQAQTIVHDAVAYARGLGFEPAGGFADAAVHLGARPSDQPVIGFGRDSKPFYFSGPYDNPRKVVQILERTCGPDNYDYVAHL
ncbi:hypothetical protein [Streptomyces sp. NL15-2K]|uniref:hypothetical protein n=1 Tax=Streptomyces sp. NL15-2K TaxID=376149 RepID=UPI000F57CDA1|nr:MULTISPECIES: hypothetical protein [Actinomycetes]WKX10572.1 helix-turn-helix domain-containing protein [Kutzneria buriramensis]GCB47888.1 hypothetical protein SNL152K_5201 [Streptomyces sp. NL15-2K]